MDTCTCTPAQLCLTLCYPMVCSLQASLSRLGVLQARILEWVAISSSRGSSWPRDWICVSWITGRFFTVCVIGSLMSTFYGLNICFLPPKFICWNPCCSLVAKSRLALCNPMDYSPPGSSFRGILQARILEWVAIPFSRGIFPTQGLNPCLLHWQADSLPLSYQGVSPPQPLH